MKSASIIPIALLFLLSCRNDPFDNEEFRINKFGDPQIREAAVYALDGEKYQDLLADLAENDEYLREATLSKLDTVKWEKLIQKIKEQEREKAGATPAFPPEDFGFMIPQQHIPAKPVDYRAKNADNYQDRIDAIHELDSIKWQDLLVDISRNDSSFLVREIALSKLDSNVSTEIIVEIAQNDKDPNVRMHAASRVWDQDILADIALHDQEEIVALAAFKNLTDQKLIARVASYADFDELRWDAVSQLDSVKYKHLLTKISKRDKWGAIRVLAAIKTGREKQIVKTVKRGKIGKRYNGYYLAVSNLDNIKYQKLLLKIAIKDLDPEVCPIAVAKITNQKFLVDILTGDIEKYTDQDFKRILKDN